MTDEELLDVLKQAMSKKDWMSEKDIVAKVNEHVGIDLFTDGFDKQVRRILKYESKDNGIISSSPKRCKFGATGYKIKVVTEGRKAGRGNKPETDVDDTLYTSKGAEFAVMTELMYSGYNANSMTVDDGIDIVASKNNIFHYIQVKSTYFDINSKKFNYSIPIEKFKRVLSHNVVYIIAVRGNSIGQFTFFTFRQSDINTNIINGYINKTDSNININVQYDSVDQMPYLVNGNKKTVAKAYENDFNL